MANPFEGFGSFPFRYSKRGMSVFSIGDIQLQSRMIAAPKPAYVQLHRRHYCIPPPSPIIATDRDEMVSEVMAKSSYPQNQHVETPNNSQHKGAMGRGRGA